jgi:plasmid rolling circle replication initiator protein Rep
MKELDDLEEIRGTGEILEDYSGTGKKIKWEKYKHNNEILFRLYEMAKEKDDDFATERKLESVYCCGHELIFAVDAEGNKSLYKAYFCKDKLCPLCAWRKSLKMFAQISTITDHILQDKKVEFLFVTLTIRNVTGEKLSETISQLIKAYSYVVGKSKTFAPAQKLKKNLLGSMRAIEITYNSEADTYHPHIHAILEVKPTYFKKDYVKKDELIEMWQKALGVDYRPSIDVRRIDNNAKAIAETAKYPVKVNDLLFLEDKEKAVNAVMTLVKSTYKRHLISFFGDFKEYRKKLELDDIEDGDLVHVETENHKLNAIATMVFRWEIKAGIYIC